ncbi:limonene-1,2-epoxide hydrolase, partial [Mycobacterium sp. 20091114027_K0903767]|nr:limonene-1,2-epoxide hydrolase [Mycobacterium sp. 20091114027_K0903767]
MADQSTTAAASQTSTVETFLNALQEQDFDTAESTLAQNLVYQNVGLPTVYGRNRAMKLFRSMPGWMGFEVKIHRIAADGAAVLTERTDALVFGPLRLQFWVCGVFEVH